MNSLRDWLEASGHQAVLREFIKDNPRDYSEFMGALYEDLDRLIDILESDGGDWMTATEDEISRELVRLLKAARYIATHETSQGGHVDVTVSSRDSRFSWLAEAKIWNGSTYIRSGLDQLVDRYTKGTPGHNRGALLIYFQRSRCSDFLATWRTDLEAAASDFPGLTLTDCTARPSLSFFSSWQLERLGSKAPKYEVRHMAVSLFRAAGKNK